MLKIKFKNQKEVEYTTAIETEEYWGGASRRTLTFKCEPTAVSIDELNTVLSNEQNTAEIILTNTEMGAENIYDGYVLKLAVGVNRVVDNAEQNTFKDVLEIKLGKRTYIEEQLKKLGL